MKIVFFGSNTYGLPALEIASAFPAAELVAVVTSEDKARGRSLEIQPSPLKAWALSRRIPCIEYSRASQDLSLEKIHRLSADLWVVVSFGFLLPEKSLRYPPLGAINLHASLLPRHRGASPIQACLLEGDVQTGVSVMRLVKELDAGDVMLKKSIPIEDRETYLTLEKKLSFLSAEALSEALTMLKTGRVAWHAQNSLEATRCKKIKKDAGRIQWNKSSLSLDREIRAYVAWPGSYTTYQGKRILIRQARATAGSRTGVPGEILSCGEDGVHVATGSDTLILEWMQAEGRKILPAVDFVRGFPLEQGSLLE